MGLTTVQRYCAACDPCAILRELTKTTTLDYSDGISKGNVSPISPIFYNITLFIDDSWIPVLAELKNAC